MNKSSKLEFYQQSLIEHKNQLNLANNKFRVELKSIVPLSETQRESIGTDTLDDYLKIFLVIKIHPEILSYYKDFYDIMDEKVEIPNFNIIAYIDLETETLHIYESGYEKFLNDSREYIENFLNTLVDYRNMYLEGSKKFFFRLRHPNYETKIYSANERIKVYKSIIENMSVERRTYEVKNEIIKTFKEEYQAVFGVNLSVLKEEAKIKKG